MSSVYCEKHKILKQESKLGLFCPECAFEEIWSVKIKDEKKKKYIRCSYVEIL
jgi:hypothetical protein